MGMGEGAMIRYIAVCAAVVCMTISPAKAATAAVGEAIKTLNSIALEEGKLSAVCKALDAFVEAGEDDAKQAAADFRMTELFESFGPQYEGLWQVYQDSDPDSEDGQLLDEAFTNLESKCGT